MLRKFAIFTLACLLSWWPMMALHELGHILMAFATGGTVTYVELRPWFLSRTDVFPNPHPLAVCWAGPISGALLPLIFYAISTRWRKPSAPFTGFLAGFCLIANGAYLSLGTLDKVGDPGDMLRHGTPSWATWTVGILSLTAGLAIWHIITKPSAKPL